MQTNYSLAVANVHECARATVLLACFLDSPPPRMRIAVSEDGALVALLGPLALALCSVDAASICAPGAPPTRCLRATATSRHATAVRAAAAVWSALEEVFPECPRGGRGSQWHAAAELAAAGFARAALLGADPLVIGSPYRHAAAAQLPPRVSSAVAHDLAFSVYVSPAFAAALAPAAPPPPQVVGARLVARGFAFDGPAVFAWEARSDDAMEVLLLAEGDARLPAVRRLRAAAAAGAGAAGAFLAPEAASSGDSGRAGRFTLPLRGFPAGIAGGALRAAADAVCALVDARSARRAVALADERRRAVAAAAATAQPPLAFATGAEESSCATPPPPPLMPAMAAAASAAAVAAATPLAELARLSRAQLGEVERLGGLYFSPAKSKALGSDGGGGAAAREALVARTLAHSALLLGRLEEALSERA